jgi:hypothetical protein
MRRSASARVVSSAWSGRRRPGQGCRRECRTRPARRRGPDGRRSEPAALDARDMLAHRVHRRDRRAGGEQRLVDGDLVGKRQVPRRRRQQRRAAAADQRDDEVVLGQATRRRSSQLRRPSRSPAVVRHRMRSLEDLDALAWRRVAVARDDHAPRAVRPRLFRKHAAICAEPLPAPITIVRPLGFRRQVVGGS